MNHLTLILIKFLFCILCHDYHHIDSNIEKKLLDNYDNFITLKLFNTNNSSTLIDAYSDLIITTQPLNLIGKEVIVVSPIFYYDGSNKHR